MRHRAINIGWLLLLGAAINVAVAWGCEIWINVVPCAWCDFARQSRADQTWRGYRWSQPGAACIAEVFGELRGTGDAVDSDLNADVMPAWLSVRNFAYDDAVANDNRTTYLLADARGWPCLSLWSQQRRVEWPQTPVKVESSIHAGLDVHLPVAVFLEKQWNRCIPLRPIWPGFAINTIVYAAAMWLMAAMLNAIVRRARRERRLCPACGYPMGLTGVCSECGARLPRAMP